MKRTAIAGTILVLLAGAAGAGTIENACLKSDRRAASRALCGCIQKVADATLGRSDQRLAASFFSDPHRSQEVRQSDSRNNERFWQRYVRFGAAAEVHCRTG